MLLDTKNTYRVFVDITFSGSILSNLVTCANHATHFPPPRDRMLKTREPVHVRSVASIVCDADSFQSPSDEIYCLGETVDQEGQELGHKLSRRQAR